MSLPKAYIAADYESEIYAKWEQSGAFQPTPGKGEPFSIVLPPPNATGTLHLGHAVMIAIEDTLVRFARMQGRETVWVPGTDHAAIATENVVINKLRQEGIQDPRQELGRAKLIEEIKKYVATSQDTIRDQIRATGASVDWSRERYTMDTAQNAIVNKVFVQMYNDGLIYRGNRIVNWDPNLETNVSDDEVEHKDNVTPFYTLQYGPFQIGTARPETKFGDKYVVMHPDDERYKQYQHGDTFEAAWLNGKVTATIIKDEAVDPEFGTGVMTITPWHDHTDFEIAQRHNLDVEQIIGLDGKLLDIAGEFKGLDIVEARPKIVAKLEELGLLIATDDNYHHRLAINQRGGGLIEPQIREQWFINVDAPVVKWKGKNRSLKDIMLEVVASGDVTLIPERFDKIYNNWIKNLHDWCISRQIWWGHRIPAWYRENGVSQKPKGKGKEKESATANREVYVGTQPPEGKGWQQDEDTLDTWFSSATWTWSTLVDQELAANPDIDLEELFKRSPDFKKFHPTTLLETGYDIIFFWVARMILMTTYATGQVPFNNVYLHGMVRTRDGQKMSKSKPETAIDPLEVIPEYGADALRLSMIIGQTPGTDNKLYKEKIAASRNFCNKLWNVGRFIEGSVDPNDWNASPQILCAADAWMFNRLQTAITQVTQQLESYRISDAGQTLYSLLWDDFADWYVEVSKARPNGPLLTHMYQVILQLLHPIAPFVTEVLWSNLGGQDQLITSPWPSAQKLSSTEDAAQFEELIKIVTEIRELGTDLQLSETRLYHVDSQFLQDSADIIMQLTGIQSVKSVVDGTGIHLTKTAINCWLDVEENITRNYLFKLIKRRDQQKKLHAALTARLGDKNYTSKAPKELVEETKDQLTEVEGYIARLEEQIENLEQIIKLQSEY